MHVFLRLLLTAAFLLTPLVASASTWKIDPEHSSIQFKIKHLGLAYVRGIFEKFQGSIRLDEQNLGNSMVQVNIEVASVNSAVPKRDEHLRSADFF